MKNPGLLETVLQPGGLLVVSLPIHEAHPDGLKPHALEFQTRGPRGTNLESPELLFEYAKRIQEEPLVDRARLRAMLNSATHMLDAPAYWMRVQDTTVWSDREFLTTLSEAAEARKIPLSKIIIEIAEYPALWSARVFKTAVQKLREEGVRIALNELGAGMPSYRMMIFCPADYIKLGQFFVQDCHLDGAKQKAISSVVSFASKLGMRVVGTAVEHLEDMDSLVSLGVDLVQGPLLTSAIPWMMHSTIPGMGLTTGPLCMVER